MTRETTLKMSIGVVGLGKLGLPLALTFAQAGHEVLAWDVDPRACNAVLARKSHIDEPDVQDMLTRYTVNIASPEQIAWRASVVFVVVPTPSLDDGTFDNSYIIEAIESLGEGHGTTIAIVSTVSPGALTNTLEPLARELGADLIYTPTLIALGTVVRDLTHPDVMIVGATEYSIPTCHALVNTVDALMSIAPSAPVELMDFESAAIAKLASNVFVTMKIGFINAVAQLCDQYAANVDSVSAALGHNQRIGSKSLIAGSGFGGPCFPRDAHAFAAAGGKLGAAVHELNDAHHDYIIRQTRAAWSDATRRTFIVLGQSYKQGTDLRIESFGDRIAQKLKEIGVTEVDDTADADIVVVAQPLQELDLVNRVKKGAFVYDLWRRHSYLAYMRTDVTYAQLGGPVKS